VNAQSISKIFRDQPQNPLDVAVYWTEYVIRHGGALHLRSGAADLNDFVYYSLDVLCLLGAFFLMSLYIANKCLNFLFCRKSKAVEEREIVAEARELKEKKKDLKIKKN
jgi:glucuronosyltransferase